MAVKGPWKASSRFDRAIVLLLFFVAVGGLWWSLQQGSGAELVVEQDGRVRYVMPLVQEAEVEIEGPLGTTVIEVHAGRARVLSASCPQRLCIGMGGIQRQGEVVACLPNRVLLRVKGAAREQNYDYLTQ